MIVEGSGPTPIRAATTDRHESGPVMGISAGQTMHAMGDTDDAPLLAAVTTARCLPRTHGCRDRPRHETLSRRRVPVLCLRGDFIGVAG
jgi:hypothetical protein